MTLVTGTTKDAGGNVKGGVEVFFELLTPSAQSNGDVFIRQSTVSSGVTGSFYWEELR